MEYYTNKKNIPNQNLVNDTIEYFQSGPGSRAFQPLGFLNFFGNQYYFLNTNITESEKVITTLKALPLNEIENHLYWGFYLNGLVAIRYT
jgi:hypothetical protein